MDNTHLNEYCTHTYLVIDRITDVFAILRFLRLFKLNFTTENNTNTYICIFPFVPTTFILKTQLKVQYENRLEKLLRLILIIGVNMLVE